MKVLKKNSTVDVKVEDVKVVLTKPEEKLVDEGARLSKIMKESDTRLKQIKIDLGHLPKGVYVTKGMSILEVVTKSPTEVDPSVLYNHLAAEGKSGSFFQVVKVVKASCDDILGKQVFEKLKKYLKDVKSFSFKTIG